MEMYEYQVTAYAVCLKLPLNSNHILPKLLRLRMLSICRYNLNICIKKIIVCKKRNVGIWQNASAD